MTFLFVDGHAADARTTTIQNLKSVSDTILLDLDGKKRSLIEWQDKVILINFWATWCTPCKKEIPLLNKYQKEYKDDELQVIGIAIDNAIATKQFIKKIPIDYPVLVGSKTGTKLAQQMGNRSGALPYTVIINQRGQLVETASGLLNESYLRRIAEKYL